MSERSIRLRADIKRLLIIAIGRDGLDASDIASRAIRKGRKGGLKDVVVAPRKTKTATLPFRFRLRPDVDDATDEELIDCLERALTLNQDAPWAPELVKRPAYEEGIDYVVKPWRDGR